MDLRNKWTFWLFTAAVLALVSVPSVEWLGALRDYAGLAGSWQPTPLRPSRTTFTPREGGPEPAPELKSADFKLKAAKAESVELVGDFNAWKPGLLKMRRSGSTWTLSVPMRPGKHKYLFLVDGDPRADPNAPTADGPEGRRVSVKDVK